MFALELWGSEVVAIFGLILILLAIIYLVRHI